MVSRVDQTHDEEEYTQKSPQECGKFVSVIGFNLCGNKPASKADRQANQFLSTLPNFCWKIT